MFCLVGGEAVLWYRWCGSKLHQDGDPASLLQALLAAQDGSGPTQLQTGEQTNQDAEAEINRNGLLVPCFHFFTSCVALFLKSAYLGNCLLKCICIDLKHTLNLNDLFRNVKEYFSHGFRIICDTSILRTILACSASPWFVSGLVVR